MQRAAAETTRIGVGVAAILAVTLMFSAMDAAAKALTMRYDPVFVVWVRYAGQLAVALLFFAPRLAAVARTRRPGLQILRSALLFLATAMFFTGFSKLPLAEVIAVGQIAPLAITALAALLLGERVGPWRWAAVAAGFFGALLIIRPGGAGLGWDALYPLAGALAFAGFNVATRVLREDDSGWTTFFYTGMVGAAAATVAVPFHWAWPAATDLPLMALLALFGAGGQGMLIVALRAAPASVLAPLLYFNLVWAVLWGLVLFDEVPAPTTLLGAAVIVAAGLFLRWREGRAAR